MASHGPSFFQSAVLPACLPSITLALSDAKPMRLNKGKSLLQIALLYSHIQLTSVGAKAGTDFLFLGMDKTNHIPEGLNFPDFFSKSAGPAALECHLWPHM
jgi:hypothetical protein